MDVYFLELTDLGRDSAPSYEVTFATVVVAGSPREARKLASTAAIDEKPETWLQPRMSTCQWVGPAQSAAFSRKPFVLCSSDNAS